MQPSWHSEPFPPTGGIAAEGIRNQLGRPELSVFEVLVREAIQNSWDARDGPARVQFTIDGEECVPDRRAAIAELLGSGVPLHGLELGRSLQSDPLRLLVVSDRGTTGLGGPTRADIQIEGAAHDFVAFVRNIGEPRDKHLGAGTFGFGRTIFYVVSRARTIVVYTRCRAEDRYESRLIGCAVGERFDLPEQAGSRPHTGRHWWGLLRDDVLEPVLGDEADRLADAVGLKPFEQAETGTTIVVIDPQFSDPAEDMRAIACAIAWHAWPKMISDAHAMSFDVTWCGTPVPIPDPEQTPPLDSFVRAYRQLASGEPIECYRPRKHLGRLSLHRDLVRAQRPNYPSSFEVPIESPVHHVALLRAPHFVVKYLPGDALPGDVAEYAGVFEVDEAVDDTFAKAEPPTHDNWVASQLQGNERTWVRTAFNRIAERLRSFARPIYFDTGGDAGVPLGAASSQFASLVATSPSLGATTSTTTGSGGGAASGGAGGGGRDGGARGSSRGGEAGSAEELDEPEYGSFQGNPALLFPFRVRRAESNAVVTADAAVAVDESLRRETESPTGSETPTVLGWLGPDGEIVAGDRLSVEGRIGERWCVAVRPVADTATSVALKVAVPT